jgi:arsenate reductase
MYPKLKSYLENLDLDQVPAERRAVLEPLADFIGKKKNDGQIALINFICTHNSRRSHLSQVWAQIAASHYEIESVTTYSAGTEATAVFPKILQTLEQTGFEVLQLSEGDNPVFAIKFNENAQPIIIFSKTLDHDFNPRSGFAAVMTCDSANETCPFIAGAEKRIPIMYEDPKAFDNTDLQNQKYAERSQQIATEMMWVFSRVALST